MIKLSGKVQRLNSVQNEFRLLTITTDSTMVGVDATGFALITESLQIPAGYGAIFRFIKPELVSSNPEFLLPQDFKYLRSGDIVRVGQDADSIRVLFRRTSNHNAILLTEQCNHYCLMCSQPPKDVDDSWLLTEARELIATLPKDLPELGFTGGEPTLYGDAFIDLMKLTRDLLPTTAVHILSNGRAFKDIEFARKYASIAHHDMMVGIPIYSDDPVRHDYVVQARGAFNETIAGILNLKALHQRVEIRVVLHKQTVGRLVCLAEFIARNLLFVDHVALMGLEITGFTRANLNDLWIDQAEYKDELSQAVKILEASGVNVSIYNHQLCLVNADVGRAYRRSISDWKNEFIEECVKCSKQAECGGLFSSAKQYKFSPNIKAFSS